MLLSLIGFCSYFSILKFNDFSLGYQKMSKISPILVEKIQGPISLIIICYFFSIFFTSSSSTRCSAKTIWVSLKIAVLSPSELEMAISAYNSWRDLIYEFFWNRFFNIFLTYFRPSVSKSFLPGAATMWRWLRCYWWQVNTFQVIKLCHWPHRWCAI